MNAKFQDGKKWSVLYMKGVCTDLGLETSVHGFKRAGAQRRFSFLLFLLKHAIAAREKTHPATPTRSLAVPSTAHVN